MVLKSFLVSKIKMVWLSFIPTKKKLLMVVDLYENEQVLTQPRATLFEYTLKFEEFKHVRDLELHNSRRIYERDF